MLLQVTGSMGRMGRNGDHPWHRLAGRAALEKKYLCPALGLISSHSSHSSHSCKFLFSSRNPIDLQSTRCVPTPHLHSEVDPKSYSNLPGRQERKYRSAFLYPLDVQVYCNQLLHSSSGIKGFYCRSHHHIPRAAPPLL